MYEFRWNGWNLDKLDKHGVSPFDAEYVVNHAKPPFPEYRGDEKWRVWGQTITGDYLQVVYLLESSDVVFVIHARPLTDAEKRQLRRRRR